MQPIITDLDRHVACEEKKRNVNQWSIQIRESTFKGDSIEGEFQCKCNSCKIEPGMLHAHS